MKKVASMELFLAQRGRCFYCFRPMTTTRGGHIVGYTMDHFYPKCKGHKLTGNTVLAHARCNEEKGARNPTDSELARFNVLKRRVKERRHEIEQARREME